MAHRVGKQNPEMLRLLIELRRTARAHHAPIWSSLADRLERSRHSVVPVNVSALQRIAAPGETVAVPGKILADGELSKALTVAAFAFSDGARDKIRAAGGSAVSLHTLLRSKPEGAGVRLLA